PGRASQVCADRLDRDDLVSVPLDPDPLLFLVFFADLAVLVFVRPSGLEDGRWLEKDARKHEPQEPQESQSDRRQKRPPTREAQDLAARPKVGFVRFFRELLAFGDGRLHGLKKIAGTITAVTSLSSLVSMCPEPRTTRSHGPF